MRRIKLHGKTFYLEGELPEQGSKIPDATLVDGDLKDVTLSSFNKKPLVLLSVPSLDTETCQLETVRFHKELSKKDNLHVVVISVDLPFAQKRFCVEKKIDQLQILSDFKYQSFARNFGVKIKELGLLARIVFLVHSDGTLQYTQVVEEVSEQPEYDTILTQIQQLR